MREAVADGDWRPSTRAAGPAVMAPPALANHDETRPGPPLRSFVARGNGVPALRLCFLSRSWEDFCDGSSRWTAYSHLRRRRRAGTRARTSFCICRAPFLGRQSLRATRSLIHCRTIRDKGPSTCRMDAQGTEAPGCILQPIGVLAIFNRGPNHALNRTPRTGLLLGERQWWRAGNFISLGVRR